MTLYSPKKTENPKCELGGSEDVCGTQVNLSKSSLARVSKISGGCGATIPYAQGHFELVEKEGLLWCGMEYDQMPGHYLICLDCFSTEE